MANNQRQKNIVIQNEFFFTYDLQLGFYSKLQSINTIKLYKRDGNRFVDDTRPDNPYLTSYHPEQEVVQKILNVLQNDSFSVVLKESDMNWYKETADLYTQDKELILEHREILYNFLILKCKLCGFSEDFSIKFIRHLFELNKKEHIDLSITIDKLNGLIDEKKIWVPNSLYEDCIKEKEILKKIVETKQKEGFMFNYNNVFHKKYLDVCSDSFVKHTYEYNKNPNYFIKEGLSFNEQKTILMSVFRKYTTKNLIEIFEFNQSWKRLANDSTYINRMINDLEKSLELSMKAWR